MPWLKTPAIFIPPDKLNTLETDDYQSDPECIARASSWMFEDLRQTILKFASSETPNKLVSNLIDDLKELRGREKHAQT